MLSSPVVGRHFDLDHSTVLKAEKDVAARIKTDREFRRSVSDFIKQLRIRYVGAERVLPPPSPELISGLEEIKLQLASMNIKLDQITKRMDDWDN